MLRAIRESRITKFLAIYIALSLSLDLFMPLTSLALTSGPSQPEVQAFEPFGTTEMVDLFTGDFTYNIPLFELPGPDGGYPFNLAYHSGIGMDQEASWVGLGWSLNPGVINRNMRNMPDDFNGTDKITVTQSMRKNWTVGVGAATNLEIFGADNDKKKSKLSPSLNLGLQIYYNNYKGVGYSIDPGVSISKSFGDKKVGANLGFNLSLNSQEGIGVNPSIGLQPGYKDGIDEYRRLGFSLSAGFNSRAGLYNTSLSCSNSRTEKASGLHISGYGGTSTLSFSGTSYSPNIGSEFIGNSLSINFKLGTDNLGLFTNGNFSGYFNTQELKHNGTPNTYPAYGYLNMEKIDIENVNQKWAGDYSREKDGPIQRNTKLLASPSLNYDIYSAVGQGIGNMYRPYRSDVGIIGNQFLESKSKVVSVGGEVGLGATVHWGIDAGGTYILTTSGVWNDNLVSSNMINKLQFSDGNDEHIVSGDLSPLNEKVYFKTYGEHTAGNAESEYDAMILREEPVYLKLKRSGTDKDRKVSVLDVLASDSYRSGSSLTKTKRINRAPRGVNMQPVYNSEILEGNNLFYDEFNAEYYNCNADNFAPDYNPNNFTGRRAVESSYPRHHIGGFTALNNSGMRYVYGIPTYNRKQVDWLFNFEPKTGGSDYKLTSNGKTTGYQMEGDMPKYNADGTDHFLSKTEMPQYAHSYLLTAILGADYVDADNIPGPSDGDMGYWVKFNYVKTSDNYQWRGPYQDANHIRGWMSKPNDDKAAFMYGEKEIWYLATAETKTHVAEFRISKRQDGVGAKSEHFSSVDSPDQSGGLSYKLDEILLFTKDERLNGANVNNNAVPIKTIRFGYSYDLCKDVPNNMPGNDSQTFYDGTQTNISNGNTGGKLTLTKLMIGYKNNKERGFLSPYKFYYNTDGTDIYNEAAMDRWGNYKPIPVGVEEKDNIENPYVDQYAQNHDANASRWNLSSISLPSGGSINVDYEADRYAYVQDQVAMQMTKIYSLKHQDAPNNVIEHHKEANPDARRIYFKLEKKFNPDGTQNGYYNNINDYISINEELYFKVRIALTKGDIENPIYEYVSGYATVYATGISDTDPSLGWVELDRIYIGDKDTKYHPFSVAAWQHIRTNQPEIMYELGLDPGAGDYANHQKVALAKSLVSIVSELGVIFKGYRDYMFGKEWGRVIDLDKSFIRLRSPDKSKIGGGSRVKQIAINDNWTFDTAGPQTDERNIYGQVFDYTTIENGQTISSGVASYEPMIGGDENALRKPMHYEEQIKLKTNNNLYAELPVNEQLYPGPSVGYGKVTVRSLATHNIATNNESESVYGKIASTTGRTENEFYTAKDFPVISDHSELLENRSVSTMGKFDFIVPIPFVGAISTHRLTATQGFMIVLNDMHGKPKKVSSYSNPIAGSNDILVSSIEYFYNREDNENNKGQLNNNVSVLVSENSKKARTEIREMGVDRDFVVDLRENKMTSSMASLALNSEMMLFPPIPVFLPWPSISSSEKTVHTAVTNKVIHKSGILRKVVAFDGQSKVVTENVHFDPLTGQALLTKVNNNYDNPVYNYSVPAYTQYEGMGAAYTNIGLIFKANISASSIEPDYHELIPVDNTSLPEKMHISNNLYPGDVLMINESNKVKATVVKRNQSGTILIYCEEHVANGDYDNIKVIRSGKRNMLNASAGSVVTLQENPLNERVVNEDICQQNIPPANYNLGYNDIDENYSAEIKVEIYDYQQLFYEKLFCDHNNENCINEFQCFDEYADFESLPATIGGNYDCIREYLDYYMLNNSETSTYYSFYKNMHEQINRDYEQIGILDINGNNREKFAIVCDDLNRILNTDFQGNSDCGCNQNADNPFYDLHSRVRFGARITGTFAISQTGYYKFKLYYDNHGYAKIYEGEDSSGSLVVTLGDENEYTAAGDDDSDYVLLNAGQTYFVEGKLTQNGSESGFELQISNLPEYNNQEFSYESGLINNVLSHNAVTYTDGWIKDLTQTETDHLVAANPYATGERGIWSPEKSYAYVGIREQSAYVNTETDGVMNNVPFFNWQNSNFTACNSCSDWKLTEEVTAMGAYGYAKESRDIQGIYSANIYGYGGQTVTMTSQNARYNEIGFTSFEQAPLGPYRQLNNDYTGNINFIFSETPQDVLLYNNYEIIIANNHIIEVNTPFKGSLHSQLTGEYVKCYVEELYNGKPQKHYALYKVEGANSSPSGNLLLELEDGAPFYTAQNAEGTKLWKGKIALPSHLDVPASNPFFGNLLKITDDYAHSGNQSLYCSFTYSGQYQLNLVPEKDYVFSAWVRDDNGSENPDITVQVQTSDNDGNTNVYTEENWQQKEAVDGWHKIEFTFKAADMFQLIMHGGLYIDDIRIFPKDASVKSYVYDNMDLKLKAILDENNYATYYYYNEEGKLYLVKKETIEGIKTIKEVRNHTYYKLDIDE